MKNNNTPDWRMGVLLVFLSFFVYLESYSEDRFRFLNNKTSSTFSFTFVNNLIIIPVKVNDMDLNLILDTGMRSIVLFGKKFERELPVLDEYQVSVSGYGKKKNRPGKFSISNEVTIADVYGTNIGIVILPNFNHFSRYLDVPIDGVIGYEIFSRFVVKIDYKNKLITLSEPEDRFSTFGFNQIPLMVKDTKPYVPADFYVGSKKIKDGYFHVDTGMSREMLVFLKDDDDYDCKASMKSTVGYGIGGKVMGYKGDPGTLAFRDKKFKEINTFFLKREFSNRELQSAVGSIGSGFLSNFVIIFDYVHDKFYYKYETENRNNLTIDVIANTLN